LVGATFLCIGSGTAYYALKLFQKTIYYEYTLDTVFENEIYRRLEPVLERIAKSQVDMADLDARLSILSNKIEDISRERPGVPSQPSFTIKSIFLLCITLAAFVFIVEYPLEIIPYLLTIIYLMWWFAITAEFKLYKSSVAWAFGLIPVVLVPMLAIFLDVLFDLRYMLGILFIGVAVYSTIYYIWGAYTTKGVLPFSIHRDIRQALFEGSEESEKPSTLKKSSKR